MAPRANPVKGKGRAPRDEDAESDCPSPSVPGEFTPVAQSNTPVSRFVIDTQANLTAL